MKFVWVLIFLSGWSIYSFAQLTPEHFFADTIKYDYRMGGRTDSMDFNLGRLLGTGPSGGMDFPSLVPDYSFYSKFRNGYRHSAQANDLTPTFSALPHVGMSYTFGSAGTSVAKVNYQQIFLKQILVNLQFKNDRGNTPLRNGVFSNNDIDLLLLRKGKIWSTELSFLDHIHIAGLNNGLDTSADLSLFALKFQPVERTNANSRFRTTDLKWKNFFNVINFDSLTALGVATEHRLAISGRRFTEEDSLAQWYSLIQFDPYKTYDQYQWSQTMHQAGVYFKSKSIYLTVKGEGVYWKYFNHGVRDTVEVNLLADFKAKFASWNLFAKGKLNLIGAGQGWKLNAGLDKKWRKVDWQLHGAMENIWADPFLRYYSANNFNYNLSATLEKQFYSTIENNLRVSLLEKLSLNFGLSASYFENNLMFNGETWSTDAALSSFFVQQLKLRGEWKPLFLSIQPEYIYTNSNDYNYIPQHSAKLRFVAKGKLFKAKKLVAWIGTDLHVYSSTHLLEFIPAMDTYVANSMIASPQTGMVNLHVFGGLQIDEFRFFARFENIGTFWNQADRYVLKNHPIPGGIFLVGITWDFFN